MVSAELDKLHPELQQPRLDRSPHPYHRRSSGVPDRIYRPETIPTADLISGETTRDKDNGPVASGQSARERAKLTTSPSDSGTEADDERPVLRAITAPPLRPRKGLRKASGSPAASPLRTPSSHDDDKDPFSFTPSPNGSLHSDIKTTESNTEKVQRKRRYIVLRRTLETLFLGLVGKASHAATEEDYLFELKTQTLLTTSLYALYAIKILLRRVWIGWGRGGRLGVRIPITKDPAPLLYPTMIPVFVALISSSRDQNVMLTNFALCICSVPSKAIPFESDHVHWVLSLAPLSYRRWTQIDLAAEERLALLFPLHWLLKRNLAYLTTTSLLQTELQLLTVAMVNLLLFAASPQALIVKALLWVGGFITFVCCKDVLRWTVSLARIPSWRYRQVKHGIFKRSPILRAIDGILGGLLSSKIESSIKQMESESDDEDAPSNQRASRPSKQKEESREARSSSQNRGMKSSYSSMVQNSRQRRNTLPALLPTTTDFQLRRTASLGLQKIRDRPRTFRALTSAQAVLLKWIYAGYTYAVVVGIILGPVRLFIGRYALSRHEPFGWALGYLFGALPSFRLRTVYWRFDEWIPLPLYNTSGSLLPEPSNLRLLIAAHIFGTLTAGLVGVLKLASLAEVDTRRKVFHGMMVTMFLPTILIDPCFIALALALALAVFLLLDLFRASQLPPLSRPLTMFLAPYVDGRDHRGPVIVSHIFLLIGCAIPLWLELASTSRSGQGALSGWDVPSKSIGLVSGVVCVGMGDAAASLIGRRFGRRRWPWGGGKSLEGSAAFAAAVVVGLVAARLWLRMLAGWERIEDQLELWQLLGKAATAACGASFTEAVLTGANDNVLVPVVLWLLVKGLGL